MMFGPWGNEDEADSVRIIHRTLDAGINFIDTAGVSPAGSRRRSSARRSRTVAKKFFMPKSQDAPNSRGESRRWIIREVENSLRRLGADRIDLYQVHRPSPDTDVAETLCALSDLVHQGKIRHIGSSSYSGSQVVEAQWIPSTRSSRSP
ncbi:hypothetical protein GQF42_38125 [Streptomyces broussonetiae]|uniref:NADP-dependent oxidoreductase domain-containing protein n=2 Tax=Streptomyces broussonetiae TaxID=2686304 RepID=A0A6I6NJA5_9ACTN|nr:hypothetical protein GQF42_38125 [Streptomyces broussonetiae]